MLPLCVPSRSSCDKRRLLNITLAQNGPIEGGFASEDETAAMQASHSGAFDIDNLLPTSVGTYLLFYKIQVHFRV